MHGGEQVPARKEHRGIHIRVEPALHDETAQLAAVTHEGNIARYSRDAIRVVNRLRRVLGPRFELEVARIGSVTDDEKAEAA